MPKSTLRLQVEVSETAPEVTWLLSDEQTGKSQLLSGWLELNTALSGVVDQLTQTPSLTAELGGRVPPEAAADRLDRPRADH